MANPEHLAIVIQGTEAITTWRQRCPGVIPDLRKARLEGISLGGADLRNADFKFANLRNSDLRGARLSGADFMGAELDSAHLNRAELCNANLLYASLRDADLSDADLRGARFVSVNLANAAFGNCIIGWSQFDDVDLSATRAIETANHEAPSTVGVNALYASRGEIAEAFLRGCGVPDNLIAYLPTITNTPLRYYSCFISYSHADRPFARRLHSSLQGRGIRCWLDEHQLLPGDDIQEQIDRGIRLWDKVVLCASKASLTSWWVDSELDAAFEKERRLMKERGKKVLVLVPLNLDGYLFSGCEGGKARQIQSRIAADFTDWEMKPKRFRQALEMVIRSLRMDGGGREPPPEPGL